MSTTTSSPEPQSNGPAPYFKEEREGWHGYIEWEKYPDKKREAAKILAEHQFDKVCYLILLDYYLSSKQPFVS